MAKTSKQHDLNHIAAGSGSDLVQVPMVRDDQSFDGRQAQRLRDIEKHLETEMRRKKRDWEREVQRMREEFLLLYPDDEPEDWTPSEDSSAAKSASFVVRRKGSTDVLDTKKMRTLIVDSLETGRKFKVRFNVSGFDPKSIQVSTDGERIIVRAVKVETDDLGHETRRQEYSRKIMKPKDVDHTKFKSYLTSDSVLIVESPFPAANHDLRRTIHSPSHSHHGGGGGTGGGTDKHASPSRSCSPSNSVGQDGAGTPSKEKIGVPIFREEESGRRRMHLVVELGMGFSPPEIVVQAIKDNKVMVKAKHEEKTTERLSKNKYCKEFELGEKIDNYSLTASLEPDGRLIVGASVKVHGKKTAAVAVEGEGGSASGAEDGTGGQGAGSKHSSPQHTVVVKAGDGKGEA